MGCDNNAVVGHWVMQKTAWISGEETGEGRKYAKYNKI